MPSEEVREEKTNFHYDLRIVENGNELTNQPFLIEFDDKRLAYIAIALKGLAISGAGKVNFDVLNGKDVIATYEIFSEIASGSEKKDAAIEKTARSNGAGRRNVVPSKPARKKK